MTLHEQLIEELLYGNVVRTPREEAARNEILKLRGQSKTEPLVAESPKGRRVKAEDDSQPVSR
jgi:hypothetical protein